MRRNKMVAVLLVFIMAGCAEQMKINYAPTLVPEENGIKLTQITEENDHVVGPYIGHSETGKLIWYANSVISVSPDSQSIGFLGFNNQSRNIYIKKIRGGLATVQRTFRNSIIDLAFSTDSKNIAFTEETDGNDNIFMINANQGAAVQQITSTPANETGPAFSKDKKTIYFSKAEVAGSTKDSKGNITYTYRYNIWSFNKETSLLTQYTEGSTPNPMPDGEKVLMTRINKETNNGEIWMFNAETGQETMILHEKERGFSSPQISPDGKTIVFVGSTPKTKAKPENLDIYTCKIDGTGLTQLTFHPGHDVSPVWSADGKSIYFLSQRGNDKGNWNVWKMEFLGNQM